jgi:hypothetical protein
MRTNDVYVDLDGTAIPLTGLDAEERQLVARLRRRARTNPDWTGFRNYWVRAVPAFYRARGMPRKAVLRTVGWRIAQDLGSRLGIAAGMIRPPDLLGDLEGLVLEHFPSRQAFARATGIPEDLLDDLLAGRKPLSLEVLEPALERIGYRLQIRPAPDLDGVQRPAARPTPRRLSRAVGE